LDNQNYKNVFKNTQVSGVHNEGVVIESLPLSNIKTRQGLMLDGRCVVTSVLAPGSGIQSGNGAKQIDVIARIVFPAMFGVLNIIYWSYYLTRANMVTEHAK